MYCVRLQTVPLSRLRIDPRTLWMYCNCGKKGWRNERAKNSSLLYKSFLFRLTRKVSMKTLCWLVVHMQIAVFSHLFCVRLLCISLRPSDTTQHGPTKNVCALIALNSITNSGKIRANTVSNAVERVSWPLILRSYNKDEFWAALCGKMGGFNVVR